MTKDKTGAPRVTEMKNCSGGGTGQHAAEPVGRACALFHPQSGDPNNSAGDGGINDVPGGEKIRQTLEESARSGDRRRAWAHGTNVLEA